MEFDLGFLGGGQLARMSIQAAQRMGLRCLSLDPAADSCSSQIAPSIQGRLDDPEAIARLLKACRRATLENEFIPAEALREAMRIADFDDARLVPGTDCLATIQDKLLQRQAYARFGVPSPRAVPAAEGMDEIGVPFVLKARFGGYDGKGTRYARTQAELASHADVSGSPDWLAEEFVPFRREVAAMVYRTPRETGCFPTMETVQTQHVCDLVFPSGVDASEVAIAAVEAVGGFGLFGVEMFETEDGRFLVNEIAPRPHNTGHYTLDWGGVSQFEQHVRLAMGWKPAVPEGGPCAMANLLGPERDGNLDHATENTLMLHPDAHVHWYGKQARPGRKVGHINVRGGDKETARAVADQAAAARAAFFAGWAA